MWYHLIKLTIEANIWALKDLGVQKIIAVTAVGGITALLSPGTIVIPHQIIDYTYGRENTFFDGTIKSLEHIDFTQPYNSDLRTRLIEAAEKKKLKLLMKEFMQRLRDQDLRLQRKF